MVQRDLLNEIGYGSTNTLWYDIWEDALWIAKAGWPQFAADNSLCTFHLAPWYRCDCTREFVRTSMTPAEWLEWVDNTWRASDES